MQNGGTVNASPTMNQKLQSYFKEARTQAQQRFGPAEQGWSFEGFYFEDGKGPMFDADFARQTYRIRVSAPAWHRSTQGRFYTSAHEIAHEVVHSLSPTKLADDTNLEEGAAVWFANVFYKSEFGLEADPAKPPYARPLDLVTRIIDADAAAICELRRARGRFRDITADDLGARVSGLTEEERQFLTAPFKP